MLQHFIIEGRHLGSANRTFSLLQGGKPNSYGFFCHSCGKVFAVAPLEGRPWEYWSRTCEQCSSAGSTTLGIPGSVWLAWDPDFIAAFPDAVLRWEFDRHSEWFERNSI